MSEICANPAHWMGLYVDAEELEDGIKDLISRERGSKQFEDLVRESLQSGTRTGTRTGVGSGARRPARLY